MCVEEILKVCIILRIIIFTLYNPEEIKFDPCATGGFKNWLKFEKSILVEIIEF